MAVTCVGGELVDVRFCISKDLSAFIVCPKVSGHTCHSSSYRSGATEIDCRIAGVSGDLR